MTDESDMQDWWKKIGEDARAAWCLHADGGDAISPAMAESVGSHIGRVDSGWIHPFVATADHTEGISGWMMNDDFAAFVRRQCEP